MPLKEFKANLLPGIKELTLNVKKNLLTTAMSGELASKLKGRGIEFEDYRYYSPSDDATRIDWRASQRSQRLLVREYKLDVNFNVFFLIDTSESMLFSSTGKLKCEYAAELVNSIFYGILSSGNAVGFALFNDEISKMIKPAMGRKQFHLFLKEIEDVKNYGGKKDIGKSIKQALSILDRKSLIFLVSDFNGDSLNLGEYLKIISHVHEVIGIMIKDPLDIEIPKKAGQLLLQDPFSEEKMYVDAKEYAELYKEENERQRDLVRAIFKKNKSKLLELRTDQNFYRPLLFFFRTMGARWR